LFKLPTKFVIIQRKTSLSENVIASCLFLRNYSFVIGVEEQALALQALC
jgi:hypothetical protein